MANTTGTIYRMALDGTAFVILHRFGIYSETNVNGNPINLDGAYPESALIEGSDGYLYGVTRAGGANGTGVVFRLSRDGSGFSVLHEFGPVTSLANEGLIKNVGGSSPVGSLVQAPDGYLYGTASVGGVSGRGTIFRIQMDGTGFEVVHEFTSLSTASPPVNVDGVGSARRAHGRRGRLPVRRREHGRCQRRRHAVRRGPEQSGPEHCGPGRQAVDGAARLRQHRTAPPRSRRSSWAVIRGCTGSRRAAAPTRAARRPTSGRSIRSRATVRDFTKLYSFDGKDGSGPYGPLLQLDAATFVGIAAAGGKCNQGTLFSYSATGATVAGNTTCGQKKNNSGGGSIAPGLLLLFGALGLARRRRRD